LPLESVSICFFGSPPPHEEERKNEFVIPLDVDELENSVTDNVPQSRKNPFEGLPSFIPVNLSPGFLKLSI
jgi:hypothetical protein